MDEPPVELIRKSARNLVKLNRRFHRDEEKDSRRSVACSSITSERMEEISNRLKTKSQISLAELQTLKNGLMEDPKHIETVLNVHGSLRGLVRELTGSESRKQCTAAGCLCNLGLGDAKAGFAVAKQAGPYLVTAMDSLSTELAVSCTWAIGNLCGTGNRACSVLAAQGVGSKLCALLYSTNAEIRDAAVYALTHFTYHTRDEFSPEHLSKSLEAISKTGIDVATAQLLFILSCHKTFLSQNVPENVLQNLLRELPISIQNHFNNCINICSKECFLMYLIRILANFRVDEQIYKIFIECFTPLIQGFKMLLTKEDGIHYSVLWLLGNLYNFYSNHEFFIALLR